MNSVPVDALIRTCHDLARMGFGTSTSGNCSARIRGRVYLTGSGVALKNVQRRNLAVSDLDGQLFNTVKPTKEIAFHLAVYACRPDVSAIIHVHPAHAVAVSSLLDLAAIKQLPAVTPQFVMRAGRVPVLGYFAPGSSLLGPAVASACEGSALVLQNHGVVVFADDFAKTVGILEELEENCRIWLLTRGQGRVLNEHEIDTLIAKYHAVRPTSSKAGS